jgi:hypothetical protein
MNPYRSNQPKKYLGKKNKFFRYCTLFIYRFVSVIIALSIPGGFMVMVGSCAHTCASIDEKDKAERNANEHIRELKRLEDEKTKALRETELAAEKYKSERQNKMLEYMFSGDCNAVRTFAFYNPDLEQPMKVNAWLTDRTQNNTCKK